MRDEALGTRVGRLNTGTARLGTTAPDRYPHHQGIFDNSILRPVSPYGFNGIRWESDWFLALNYGVFTLVFACLWMRARVVFRCDLS